jgi:hypothetical protein
MAEYPDLQAMQPPEQPALMLIAQTSRLLSKMRMHIIDMPTAEEGREHDAKGPGLFMRTEAVIALTTQPPAGPKKEQ